MDSSNSTNPAVQRCLEAGLAAYKLELAKSADKSKAESAARNAFRTTMPHLSGEQNIQDFIACIAVAVVRSYLYDSEVSKLLYAAQVATGALHRQSAGKSQSTAPASPKKPPAAAPETASSEGAAA